MKTYKKECKEYGSAILISIFLSLPGLIFGKLCYLILLSMCLTLTVFFAYKKVKDLPIFEMRLFK